MKYNSLQCKNQMQNKLQSKLNKVNEFLKPPPLPHFKVIKHAYMTMKNYDLT